MTDSFGELTYTITNASVYLERMTGTTVPIIKRPIHNLADGTLLFVMVDENDSYAPWGIKDGVVRISLWQSDVARNNWTKKVTYTLPAGTYQPNDGGAGPGSAAMHAGAVLMLDESLYFVWRDKPDSEPPGYALYGVKFTKSGSTWTAPTSKEDLFFPADRYPFRFDLDINRSTGEIFIGWMYSAMHLSGNTIGTDIIVRKSATVRTFLTGDYGIGTSGNVHPLNYSEDFTMAIDPASNATNTRLVYMTSCSTTSKDYGDYIGYRVVRNFDSVTIGSGWLKQGFNAGRGAGRRTSYIFATGNGEFALIGMGGVTQGEAYALKYKTTSAITVTNPVWTNPVPATYTATQYPMDRSNGLWADVSVTYANGNFVVHYHDASPSTARDIVGRFTSSSVVWETPSYTWDSGNGPGYWTNINNWRRSPVGAVYGGTRDASAINKHDLMIVYYSRQGIANAAGGGPATLLATAWAHQHNRTWKAPGAVLPAPSTNVTTSIPVLGAYADIDAPEPRSALFVKWQIASNASFTTNLREYTSKTGAMVRGTHYDGSRVYVAEKLPLQQALATGTWYIRAAQLDSFGTQSPWTATQQFAVAHPPSGKNLSPSGGSVFTYGSGNVTFAWDFEDSFEFDTQSAYRILVELNDEANTVVLDTGKITGSEDFVTLTYPLAAKNKQVKWRVQLWDVDDNAGALSSYALFMAADPPIVDITSPLDGSVVDNARPTVTWVTTDPANAGQTSYRVYFLNDGIVIHDSGWRNGGNQAYVPNDIILSNEKSYSMIISVRDGIGLETQSSVSFTTSWILPSDPDLGSLIIDTAQYGNVGGGYIRVIWQNVTADPEFLSWRLYRRYHLSTAPMVGDKGQDWELIHEEFSVSPVEGATQYTYLDYTAPSGYDVHYILTQSAVRFGSIVESRRPSLTDNGQHQVLYSGNYWLIKTYASGAPEDVIRLENATADSYTEEYELVEMQLIGRGRHFEIGDRLGYAGQLTLQVRSIAGGGTPDDPRRQKLDLERFRADRTECWIRSPFGDLFLASTGDMQFERLPGVGSSEYMTVTLPYKEVYRGQ